MDMRQVFIILSMWLGLCLISWLFILGRLLGLTGPIPPRNGYGELRCNVLESRGFRCARHQPNKELTDGYLSHRTIRSQAPMTMPRYLFPIQTKNGPSFQYQGIKAALKVALLENRTLVTSSFFKYGRFEIDSERLFQETFDVDHLRKLLPVATVTEYKDACKNESITVMWPQDIDFNNTYFKTELEQLRALVKNIFDIVIPDPDETSQGQKTPDDQDKCVMFYINDGIVQNPSPIQSRTITDLSDFHLRRTGFIRDIGSNAMSYICNGHRFAALHWRNRTGEVCRVGLRANREDITCEDHIQLLNDNSATIARAVHDAMKKDGLDCLYLAYPPYSEDILEYMAAEIPKVYTVSDILVHGIPEYMQEDEYYLSLIDQEMASRAALFMASGSSNWSDFVVDERKANGKKNIFIGNLRGIPSSIINML